MAKAMTDSPISVCGAGIGGIDELKESGFCIYDLGRMHDEFSVDYYNKKSVDESDRVAVLEVDFYRADSFVDWDDDQIADLALRAVSAALDTAMINSDDTLLDAAVLRARNAVSHFSPNSALYSPDVKLENGLYICGDWVDRTGHAHLMCVKQQAGVLLLKDSIVNDGEGLLVSFIQPIMMKTQRLVVG